MTKIFVVSKRQLRHWLLIGLMALGTLGAAWYWGYSEAKTTSGSMAPQGEARTIHLVTGEFKSTDANGKTIEAYRWDPGTIHVKQGEPINLSIFGVNGTNHPFMLSLTFNIWPRCRGPVRLRSSWPGTCICPTSAHGQES